MRPLVGGGVDWRAVDPDGCDRVIFAVREAWDFCLTDEARERARECTERARRKLGELERSFVGALAALP